MIVNFGGGDSGLEERVCEVLNFGGGLFLVFTKLGGGFFIGVDNVGKFEEFSLVFFFFLFWLVKIFFLFFVLK